MKDEMKEIEKHLPEAWDNYEYPNSVFFDVDDTLVMWNWPHEKRDEVIVIKDELDISNHVVPHQPHIKAVKAHAKAGDFVVVWSQGGAAWAQCVVDTLGLDKYVDLVIGKPLWYYDDYPAEKWMETALYRNPWTGKMEGPKGFKKEVEEKNAMIKKFFTAFKQVRMEKHLLMDEVYVLKKKLEESENKLEESNKFIKWQSEIYGK